MAVAKLSSTVLMIPAKTPCNSTPGRLSSIPTELRRVAKSSKAPVTVSARNEVDFAYIEALGCKHINTNALKSVKGYDLVFNTIPVMIFDSDLLMNTDRNTIIIDLASLPGGVDFEAARRYKTDAVRALSLPGRTAPKAAGEIIRKTIFNIIKEVYR